MKPCKRRIPIMKIVLQTLSIVNCICCLFCLLMFIFPGIVGFDDSIGFLVIAVSSAFSLLVTVPWTIYCFAKQSRTALKTTVIFALAVHILLLANLFLDFIPLVFVIFVLQFIFSIITNVLFIVFSR